MHKVELCNTMMNNACKTLVFSRRGEVFSFNLEELVIDRVDDGIIYFREEHKKV